MQAFAAKVVPGETFVSMVIAALLAALASMLFCSGGMGCPIWAYDALKDMRDKHMKALEKRTPALIKK